MSARPISVLKFGSSVLRSHSDLPVAVHEIYRELREARRVVAVVSAFGDTTDRLIDSARRISEQPDEGALAMLVATGESRAAAMLAIALDRAGVPSIALDAANAGLATRGALLDSEPTELDVGRIERELDDGKVVVIPGFVGRDEIGRIALLGRGGSDLSALFVAQRLRAATCRLLKDVDGVWDRDPAEQRELARRFAALSFADARAIGGRIVQAKALRFAEDERVAFEVSSPGSTVMTRVGAQRTAFEARPAKPRRLRVGLLGLGTVGLGVYREIAREPERFELARVLVRRRRLAARRGVARELLASDFEQVLAADCDVIVEALGGVEPASSFIDAALQRGIAVVTANKAAVAVHGARWRDLASLRGATLAFSAAVGGAVPMLEAVRRCAREREIVALEGILNATTNFVLELMGEGLDLATAVERARELGFCEADPKLDLDGTDAAQKLELLARAAFGEEARVAWRERDGIERITPADLELARAAGESVHLVAELRRVSDRIEASVAPRRLRADHALAPTRGEHNALAVHFENGAPLVLRGKGAGRYPTTESMLGDLLDLSRSQPSAALARNAAS